MSQAIALGAPMLVMVPGVGWTIAAVLVGGTAIYVGAQILFKETKNSETKKGTIIDVEDYTEEQGSGGPDKGEHDKQSKRFYQKGDKKHSGDFIQKDRSGNTHGGGSQYKLFDKNGKRIATINGKGEVIRK
jgi:hypothetical protein